LPNIFQRCGDGLRLVKVRNFIIAAAAGAASVVLGGIIIAVLVLEFGWFDISAADAHMPFVRWFVHRVMIHGVSRRATHVTVPATVPAAVVANGLCEYQQHCQMCHGGPGVARNAWANGLNPTPPYLIDSHSRWTPQELYWIISKGVKMTAMPSWKMSMSDKQMWSIVAYLENMPKIPPGAYQAWAAGHICPSGKDVLSALTASQSPSPNKLPQLPAPFRKTS
jgi:mono/diheme cytochrome c family protein